jgi:hypothetical protein
MKAVKAVKAALVLALLGTSGCAGMMEGVKSGYEKVKSDWDELAREEEERRAREAHVYEAKQKREHGNDDIAGNDSGAGELSSSVVISGKGYGSFHFGKTSYYVVTAPAYRVNVHQCGLVSRDELKSLVKNSNIAEEFVSSRYFASVDQSSSSHHGDYLSIKNVDTKKGGAWKDHVKRAEETAFVCRAENTELDGLINKKDHWDYEYDGRSYYVFTPPFENVNPESCGGISQGILRAMFIDNPLIAKQFPSSNRQYIAVGVKSGLYWRAKSSLRRRGGKLDKMDHWNPVEFRRTSGVICAAKGTDLVNIQAEDPEIVAERKRQQALKIEENRAEQRYKEQEAAIAAQAQNMAVYQQMMMANMGRVPPSHVQQPAGSGQVKFSANPYIGHYLLKTMAPGGIQLLDETQPAKPAGCIAEPGVSVEVYAFEALFGNGQQYALVKPKEGTCKGVRAWVSNTNLQKVDG